MEWMNIKTKKKPSEEMVVNETKRQTTSRKRYNDLRFSFLRVNHWVVFLSRMIADEVLPWFYWFGITIINLFYYTFTKSDFSFCFAMKLHFVKIFLVNRHYWNMRNLQLIRKGHKSKPKIIDDKFLKKSKKTKNNNFLALSCRNVMYIYIFRFSFYFWSTLTFWTKRHNQFKLNSK